MSWPSDADRLSGIVLDSLDEGVSGDMLARRAYRSRTQFFRVFRAVIDETPAAMRRRLRLERAAWQLSRTRTSITEVAFDAAYGSLEAFTRAFRRAFRISPSVYRRMGATHFYLPAPGGIHFQAPDPGSEGDAMDLFDLFFGSDSYHVKKLLEHARELRADQLDAPLDNPARVFPWDTPGAEPAGAVEAAGADEGDLDGSPDRRRGCRISSASVRSRARPTRSSPGSRRRMPTSGGCWPTCETGMRGATRSWTRCASRRRRSLSAGCSPT